MAITGTAGDSLTFSPPPSPEPRISSLAISTCCNIALPRFSRSHPSPKLEYSGWEFRGSCTLVQGCPACLASAGERGVSACGGRESGRCWNLALRLHGLLPMLNDTLQNEATIRLVRPGGFSKDTAQTPGSRRLGAIAQDRGIPSSMWGGLFTVPAGGQTPIHHHGK